MHMFKLKADFVSYFYSYLVKLNFIANINLSQCRQDYFGAFEMWQTPQSPEYVDALSVIKQS